MNIKLAPVMAALLGFGLSASLGPQSVAQETLPRRQSLAIPLTVAAAKGKPAPSVQCTVTYGPTAPMAALAFDPAGKLLAVGGYQEVLVWDLAGGELAKRIGAGQLGDVVHALAFTAAGQLLAVGDGTPHSSGAVKIFSVKTGQPVGSFDEPQDVVYSLAFSPDGQTLAMAVGGSLDRTIRLRRTSDARLTRTTDTGAAMPLDLVWVAQGNRIYAPASDNTVKAYNAGNGRLERTFTGHTDWVYSVALSADATRVASGSADGTVKLWNTADGALLATLIQLSPRTDQWLVITPRGYLATSSADAIEWKTTNVTMPPEKITSLFQNAELLPKAIAGEKVATPVLE